MKPAIRFLLGVTTLACAASSLAADNTARSEVAEPKIQRIVVEDDGARIEELRVRGQTQRIVVAPKRGGAGPYEIIPGDGARDMSDSANASRGAAGKRVWNVLSF